MVQSGINVNGSISGASRKLGIEQSNLHKSQTPNKKEKANGGSSKDLRITQQKSSGIELLEMQILFPCIPS